MTGVEPGCLPAPAPGWPMGDRLSGVPAWAKAVATLDAVRLVQLGARAGLVCQLTGVDKAAANRLYRQIHGRPSPPGQSPFTDTWYLKSDRRMLHAAAIWQIHKRLGRNDAGAARTLIDVYETYRLAINDSLLDITHAAFVPRLVEMKLWHERECGRCATPYVTPVEEPGSTCPGCRLYQRYRCLRCGTRAEGVRRGRRRSACPHCGQLRLK